MAPGGFLQDRKEEIEESIKDEEDLTPSFDEPADNQTQDQDQSNTDSGSSSSSSPSSDPSGGIDIDPIEVPDRSDLAKEPSDDDVIATSSSEDIPDSPAGKGDGTTAGNASDPTGTRSQGEKVITGEKNVEKTNTPSPSERTRGETNIPSPETLPDTRKQLQDVREFRNQNKLIKGAQPAAEKVLDTREQALDTRQEINTQIENIEAAPETARFRNSEGETVTRQEALETLTEEEKELEEEINRQEEAFDNFNEIIGNTDRQEQLNTQRRFRDASDEPIPILGQATTVAETAGRQANLAIQGTKDPLEAVRTVGESSRIQGAGTMAQGEKIRSSVENSFNNVFNPQVVDEQGREINTQELNEADREFFQGENIREIEEATELERDFIGTATGSTATFGTMAGGVGIAAPGAAEKLAVGEIQRNTDLLENQEDTLTTAEAFTGGGRALAEEVKENPGEFVVEESFEEVGEAAVGAALTGGTGAALGAVPTPEITPEVDVRGRIQNFDPFQTRKGSAAIGNKDSTPSFVRDFTPETPEQEVTGRDIGTTETVQSDIQAEQELENDLIGGSGSRNTVTSSTTSLIEGSPSTPESISAGLEETSIDSQVESNVDVLGEVVGQTNAETQATTQAEVDALADVRTEPSLQPELRNEVRSDPSLEVRFMPENEEGLLDTFQSNAETGRQESNFAPTLGGLLSGESDTVTEEEAERLDQEQFSGLGQRNPLNVEENGNTQEKEAENDINNLFGI